MRAEQGSLPGIPGQSDLWQLGVGRGWAALPPIYGLKIYRCLFQILGNKVPVRTLWTELWEVCG